LKSADKYVAAKRRFKHVIARLFLIAAGVVVAFLLFEAFLRIVGYSSGTFYRRDDVIGATLRPGAEGWWTREGHDYIRINSDGLRDREHSLRKPANTYRIAVLGDSYAEALQLPMQKAFWSVMESRLHRCPSLGNRTVEVINFGVSGYGTAQELLMLRQKVWKYEPDLVLLAVTTGNDISDDSRQLKGDLNTPYFVLSDGRLVLDDAFRSSRAFRWHKSAMGHVWDWAIDRSLALQAIREAANTISDKYQTWRAPQTNGSTERGLFKAIYHQPANDTWRNAWLVTEALISEMNKEVRDRGAQFVVVTLSSPTQVHPDPKFRAQFMQAEGINDLLYPDRRIESLCHREGIRVLVLAPLLQNYAEQNQVFLHGFDQNLGGGHWNERGHAIAGELIADWLCALLPNAHT
jgi:lysophospholipase L1-like esterase